MTSVLVIGYSEIQKKWMNSHCSGRTVDVGRPVNGREVTVVRSVGVTLIVVTFKNWNK